MSGHPSRQLPAEDAVPADPDKLVVAITARALFDLEDSHGLFQRDGVAAYVDHQRLHENDALAPGIAFPLVRKLLALNRHSTAAPSQQSMASDALEILPIGPSRRSMASGALGLLPSVPRVEVILLSRNSGETGLRIFNSIEHYGLDIVRAVFTSGAPTFPYIQPFGAQLFLSANPESVRHALQNGVAAATILPASDRNPARQPVRNPNHAADRVHDQLRIAFDGDAVIFGDESERVSQESGLAAFTRHERERENEPLSGGPFRGFLAALHRLQAAFPEQDSPIRTALVTARSAPAHKRVILTLREWGVRLDEALFLGGRDKGPFLQAFGADIFFDDSSDNIESARRHVAAGHVPHGVSND